MAKGTKATSAYRQHMQGKARQTGVEGVKASIAGNALILGGAAATGFSLGALAAPGITSVAVGTGVAAYGKQQFKVARGQRVRGAAIEDMARRGGRLSASQAQQFHEANQHFEASHMQGHAAEPSQGGGDIVVHEHTRRRAVPSGE